MAIDYTTIAASALAAIQSAGRSMTLGVPGAPAYSPTTAAVTASTATHAAVGVKLPVGSLKGSGFVFSEDLLVRAQAFVLLAASGLSAQPKPGHTVTIGSEVWKVIGTDTLSPAGTPVLHALLVTL